MEAEGRVRFGRPSKRDRTAWHSWFAWRPVRTLHGDYVWLETVLRKGWKVLIANGDGQPETMWHWEYMA
jgi:hypothetical protein